MSRARQTALEIVAHAAWMFTAWASVRILLSMYMHRDIAYPDALLRVVTDVEIHSLHFRWGWDVAAFLLFAAVVAAVQKARGRDWLVPTLVATVVATALSIAMVAYPALTLSGRVGSPFSGVDRTENESIAFAVVVTLVLASAIALLARAQHHNGTTRPGRWGHS